MDKVDYVPKINGCFNLLRELDKFYREASVPVKQKIVCLNFPEKLIFENGRIQTPKMNEVLSFIMLGNSELGHKKKKQRRKFFHFVPGSEPAGITRTHSHSALPLVIPMNASAFKTINPDNRSYQDL